MEILESTFASVVSLSLRATILIFLFIGIRHLGRRWIPSQILYLGWVVIALRMLVPFSVPIEWTAFDTVVDPVNQWVQTVTDEVKAAPLVSSAMLSGIRPASSATRGR